MNRVKVVIIGSGRMGKLRAAAVYSNPRFDLRGIVDVNRERATELANRYLTNSFGSLSEAFNFLGVGVRREGNTIKRLAQLRSSPLSQQRGYCNEKKRFSTVPASVTTAFSGYKQWDESSSPLDGIIVSSPTFTHKDVIQEAAGQTLSIFTEKPVDDTPEKIRHLFQICRDAGTRLCCGFQRRFDESYIRAMSSVREGLIGTPLVANIFFADHPCPPTKFLLNGGCIFSDLSAHDVDYARWCLEDEVESVYATGKSSTEELKEAGVHDNATMVVNFSQGTVVTLSMSRYASYGYDQRCEIFGRRGRVTVENQHANSSVLLDDDGMHLSRLKESFPQRFRESFDAELDAFADTILLNTVWPVSEEDCIAVQRVSYAARASCDLGEVVRLA